VGSRQNDFSDSGRESNCSTTRIGPPEAHNQALQAMLNRQAEIKVTQFRFPVRFSDHSQKAFGYTLWPTIEKVSPPHYAPHNCMNAPSLRIRPSFIKGPLTIYALSLRPSRSAYACSLFAPPSLYTPPYPLLYTPFRAPFPPTHTPLPN
jgi:hypothetical protein